jgi:type IV pilus assembly protein PilM
MGKKLLTLNIGASSVVLAEYDVGRKTPVLLKYGKASLAAPLDSGDASAILAPALHEIMRTKGIRPGKVALSLSGQAAFLRNASIPMAGGQDRFNNLVRVEIEQNIPFPIDEMVCDSQILGDMPNGDKSVMIVASKVDQVENLVSAVKSVGFTPEIIDVAPIALINLLRVSPSYDGQSAVILDIGAKTTSLSIVEGEKIYNRAIPVGGNTITKEIAQSLSCSFDEAESFKCQNAYVSMGGVTEDEDETLDHVSKICRSVMTRLHAEITRSINFYRSQQSGQTPTRIYLTGGTALLPQIAEFLQDSLQIEVTFLNPFEVATVASSCNASELEYDSVFLSVTTGLAIHGAGHAFMSINLLPPSITEARKEVRRIPFVVMGAASLVAASVLWYVVQAGEFESLTKEKNDLTYQRDMKTAQKVTNDDMRAQYLKTKVMATNHVERIGKREVQLARMESVRSVLEESGRNLWIDRWVETEREIPLKEEAKNPNILNSQQKKITVKVPVVTLTVYEWLADPKASTDDLSKEFAGKCRLVSPDGANRIKIQTTKNLAVHEYELKFEEPKWK